MEEKMIDLKYKKIYEEFLKNYEQIHVNPWHDINKQELERIVNDLLQRYDVTGGYSFCYFINYIIKRLSGTSDAHTIYKPNNPIPMNFKIFDEDVLVNYPSDLRGSKLVSINNVDIRQILKELDEVLTYGTLGKKRIEMERALFNRCLIWGLPSLKGSKELTFQILTRDNKLVTKTYDAKKDYQNEMFDYEKYLYGDNATFEIKNNCLIYHHSSCQPSYKDKIAEAVASLYQLDISNIDTIIVDLRGNTGGNSAFNDALMAFLKQSHKNLICLTDYRVFSAGRFALRDLINLGAITIGEEISTPINCYGNSSKVDIDCHNFSISSRYFHPFLGVSIRSKEEYKKLATPDVLKPVYFKPDIEINEKEEDYLMGEDTILNYAFMYIEQKRKEDMRKK